MRWVFFTLLILNLVYLVWGLVDMGTSSAEPARQYQPESDAPRELTLLDEAPESDRDGEESDNGDERLRLCPVVGPWESRSKSEEALRSLEEEAGYRGRARGIEVEKERLHWVHLPPLDSREEAMRTLRELQSRGVDSFVVDEGEDRNAISLGYFESEDSARGLRSKMNTAGYPVEIRETVEEATEYWLYIDSDSMDDDGRALREFLDSRDELSADHSSCLRAATDDGR